MVAWRLDNQPTDLSGTANDPTHDASGNMTADSFNTYIYDAWNRLVEVRDRATEDLIATYEYDGQKRRVEKTVDSSTDDYFYNSDLGLRSLGGAGWQLLETRTDDDTDPPSTGSGQAAEQYVWDIRYIDAPIARFDATGYAVYYLNDANFNVTSLVDESGTIVERYAYDPYGERTVLDADWSADADNASDVNNEVLYAGYRFDPESGLFHVRNRYYSTSLGRFITRDPLGYMDGMSVYEYVGGNAANAVDPAGLMSARELQEKFSVSWVLWKAGSKKLTLSATASIVPDCPPGCPCVDVTIRLSLSHSLKKKERQKTVPWNQLEFNTAYTKELKVAPTTVVGVGSFRKQVPNPAYQPALKAWQAAKAVALKGADATIERGTGLLGGLSVGEIAKEIFGNPGNIAATAAGHMRVCWNGEKVVGDFCKWSGTLSYEKGATKRSPLPGGVLPIEFGFSASGTIKLDLCEGTFNFGSKGVINVSIDLPMLPVTVTGDTFTLWDYQTKPTQTDKLKWLTKGDLPECGEKDD
ncbi:MAG: hypothetical protein GVY16_09350 [Planctomycetes bacterium]|jgi:RHS repeat-associated protein|nr:hypothetical protein [Planctomycetota bacterium]